MILHGMMIEHGTMIGLGTIIAPDAFRSHYWRQT